MDPQDRDIVTRTVLGEASGQSDDALAAIAHVVRNRVESGRYGDTPTDVVLQRGAFEPWSTRRRELQGYSAKSPEYRRASQIVDDVFAGKRADPTSGATHFYDPEAQRALGRARPEWGSGQPLATVGSHQFYAPEGAVVPDLLGGWNTAPAGTPAASPSAPAAAPAASEPDDLLGSWGAGAQPQAAAPDRQRIVIHPAGTVEPAPPPTPEAPEDQDVDLARSLSEHQGLGFGELAARLGIGALRGVKDVADTAAQGIAATGRAGAGALSGLGIISPQSASSVSDWASGVNARMAAEREAWERASADSPSAGVGRIGGQIAIAGPALRAVAGALPALPAAVGPLGRTVAAGAGYGGGAAALTSASSDQSLPQQVGEGALGGALMAPVGYGLSGVGRGALRALFGATDPETAQLAGLARGTYGIPVTAGQITSNPMMRFADSVLQRMPLTGYGARTVAQQTGLNRAVAAEMGVASDKVTPDVIRQAQRDAYRDYDFAKTLMGPLHLDHQFLTDLHDVQTSARYNLEPKLATLIDKHLDNVASKVDATTRTLDPDLYQSLTRKNGPLDTAINSRDSKIATHAQGIKDALENLVGRNDPALKRLKDEADYKYFVTKSVEPLAREATTGDISPAKLLRAVDYSQRGIGELGKIGQRFLNELPSSGTSERLLAMEIGKALIGGGIGLGGAYQFDPEHFQRDAALGVAAALGGRGASWALRHGSLADALVSAGRGVPAFNALPNFVRQTSPLAGIIARPALSHQPSNQ